MFDENAFSLDAFSGESMFLLAGPYFDLTGKQRVYVRHVLQSVYALDVVERIVAVAEIHNLSVVDSVDVIRVQTGDQTLFILPRKTVTIEKPRRQAGPVAPKQAKETRVAYATSSNEAIYASDERLRVFAGFPSVEPIVSSHAQEMLFITKKPSRTAHKLT